MVRFTGNSTALESGPYVTQCLLSFKVSICSFIIHSALVMEISKTILLNRVFITKPCESSFTIHHKDNINE